MTQQITIWPFEIKAIIGLGNPGPIYAYTPHNIGFLIVNELAKQHNTEWTSKDKMLLATLENETTHHKIILIKPQTFMNNSGEVLSSLHKKGIKHENILVVHDEIDFPFAKLSFKQGGSARGHNGLKSLIAHGGDNFLRLRCGVGRPSNVREDVGDFVLSKFNESTQQVEELIEQARQLLQNII